MPSLELLFGKVLEKGVRYFFLIPPGLPAFPFLKGHQSSIGLSRLCQDYLFSRMGAGEELRKVGFCLMNIDNIHIGMFVHKGDLVNQSYLFLIL